MVCSRLCDTVIHLTLSDVIIGFFKKDAMFTDIINMLILYVKYYIYRCKYDMKEPNIMGLKMHLQYQQPCETNLQKVIDYW